MKIKYNENEKIRIDKFLTNQNLEELYSRSYIDKMISNGSITVNAEPVKKGYFLAENDEIKINIVAKEKRSLIGENIPLDIVYEDEFMAIINKQAGLVVHPGAGNPNGTLVNALIYYFGKDLSSNDPSRPGIVHRLDKDTSGLIVVAKTNQAHSALSELFQNREIEKHYRTIVVGTPNNEEDEINTFIYRSVTDRTKMAVSNHGKTAITAFKIIKYFDFFSLLDVHLKTGRTHQIRVHMSHINHPIIGDQIYNSIPRTLQFLPQQLQRKVKYLFANHLKRQALHSFSLKFIHPFTGKEIYAEAPLPEDMTYTLNWLDKYFNKR